MKHFNALLSFGLLILFSYLSFYTLMPQKVALEDLPATEFSIKRAQQTIKTLAEKPHYYTSAQHAVVRNYIVERLQKLGLQPQLQEAYSLNSSAKILDKPINIIARIEGSGQGKALLLLSHYDSAALPSYGASDDGVGVATVLEGVRAFLASGRRPQNDIIILFTDAEEIGLDGAKLFVTEHPWAKDVGLTINFEARGTAGSSNMILETNHGNKGLIEAFTAAHPEFPVASSLFYSVYKILPNDTDSTMFREFGDIDGFFFAFIDNHFNYHTANDNFKNVSNRSLAHQGSYLMAMLDYFADADLGNLRSSEEEVYFNFPIINMVHYPFSWVLPMLLGACLLFLGLLIYGFKTKKLNGKQVFKGFVALVASLVISGGVTYFGWKLVLLLNPQYHEILQGFPYNGHDYIACFVFFSLAVCFYFYKKLGTKDNQASLMVGGLLVWIVINALIFVYLKGAAYFIVPVFFGLLALFLMLWKKRPNLLVVTILSVPTIFILVPLVQFFPVGLGLKMVWVSALFTVLIFSLIWPIVAYFSAKRTLVIFCLLTAGFYYAKASFSSSFDEEQRKPNSLVYYEDADQQRAYFLTYDKTLDDWTRQYLGENPQAAQTVLSEASYSKYGTGYTYAHEVAYKDIPPFEVAVTRDSLAGDLRYVAFSILPKRKVNRVELYALSAINFKKLSFNGKAMDLTQLSTKYRGTANEALVKYYVRNQEPLKVQMVVEKGMALKFKVLEYSYDLLTHKGFSIMPRPNYTMPKPFVVTDAVAVKRSFKIAENSKK